MKSFTDFKGLIQEGEVASSDFIIGKSGRRIRAHHFKVGDVARDRGKEPETQTHSADFTINKFGRKVKQHIQFSSSAKPEKMADVKTKNGNIVTEEKNEPPMVLMLKRQSIRMYPGGVQIALYYSDKIKKQFTVPFGGPNAVIQAESEVKIGDRVINEEELNALVNVYSCLTEENKEAFSKMLEEPSLLENTLQFALKFQK